MLIYPLGYIGEAVILRHVRNGVELAPIDQNLHYDFDYQLTNHITPRVVMPVSNNNNINYINWVSLSEPHSSRKNGMSMMFTKIYMETQINGISVMHAFTKVNIQKSGDNLQMLPTQRITMVVY